MDQAKADKTLVMTATYNEIENLPRLVEEVFRFAPQVDMLVIDDNSPDGTGQWCDRQATVKSSADIACTARASWVSGQRSSPG